MRVSSPVFCMSPGGTETVDGDTKSGSDVRINKADNVEMDNQGKEYVKLIGSSYFDDGDKFWEVNELWVSATVQSEPVVFCLDRGTILKYWLIPEVQRPELMSKNVV